VNPGPPASDLRLCPATGLAACQPGRPQRRGTAPRRGATALAEMAMDGASDAAITVAVNVALAADEKLSV
jgi:hypothetical protein